MVQLISILSHIFFTLTSKHSQTRFPTKLLRATFCLLIQTTNVVDLLMTFITS